jgi:L-aspartate oxidase
MADYHPARELAPRDVVARAIHAERAAGRGAFLDATAAVGEHFPHEFPAVFAACMSAAIDPRVQPIPVTPAVPLPHGRRGHRSGRPHQPARPAGRRRVRLAPACTAPTAWPPTACWKPPCSAPGPAAPPASCRWAEPPLAATPTPDLPDAALQVLRQAMSRDAGVIRDADGLARLVACSTPWKRPRPAPRPWSPPSLIARAALARQESRGGHFRADFPATALPERTFVTLDGHRAGLRYAAE